MAAQEELSEKEKIAALPERHRVWFAEEVVYIITDNEKRVFLTLTSEEQRKSFVDAFWGKRDHNPSTPENEFKIEHYERFDYVNKWFGRSTFREGWETDRGRYYIIIGPPRSIQNFEARDEIYPTELWFYNNSELKTLRRPRVLLPALLEASRRRGVAVVRPHFGRPGGAADRLPARTAGFSR